ncbi:MAG: prepilin-type N-terminal cleavage/methylation domain-containing protein [Planctomycetes bacterium]|nr:prepilin-type N-terminal cleavage/methylation domain-containing protein [Planctomycetota bacterium]
MHTRTGLRAFTLIELLVVIAIISLLISILTPSLARAREQAKSTVCMATLHEMMKGVIAYGNDYNFALPPSLYPSRPETPARHGWAEALYTSLYGEHDFPLDQDFPVMRNLENRYPLWVCKESERLSDTTGHYRVYEQAWKSGKLEGVRYRLPLICDANIEVTDEEDLQRADIPNEHIAGLEGEAFIDERHYGGANYVFKDGSSQRNVRLREDLALDWDLDPETPNR